MPQNEWDWPEGFDNIMLKMEEMYRLAVQYQDQPHICRAYLTEIEKLAWAARQSLL